MQPMSGSRRAPRPRPSLILVVDARVAELRVAGGMEAGDQDDAVAIEPVEEAVRKPLHEDPSRVSMNDGVGVGETESCRDCRLDGKDELGAQTRVLMLVPDVGGFDIIVRRREEAGCSDAHRR